MNEKRRRFLKALAPLGFVAGCSGQGGSLPEESQEKGSPEPVSLTPSGYLMRQHSVVRRLLYIYGRAADMLQNGSDLPAEFSLLRPIAQDFIVGHHEHLEEEYVFPALTGSEHVRRVTHVLERQHAMGQTLTKQIFKLADNGENRSKDDRERLQQTLRMYCSMFRVHAVWEDSELFPIYHTQNGKTSDRLRKELLHFQREQAGGPDFSTAVTQVMKVEKALGIKNTATMKEA